MAAVGVASDEAAPLQRRMQASQRCTAEAARGLPVLGVRYTPHLVGEPFPHPESEPGGFYSNVFAHMHARDLPLIGGRVGADTLALRPWPTDGSLNQRAGFFEEMIRSGICKAIPSFNAAKYYADMLRQGRDKLETNPSSPLAVDFSRFGATVDEGLLRGVEMVAWTVDLSLDLKTLLPLVGDECASSKITQDKSFQKYIRIMTAIQRWVHPGAETASVAPALAAKPFLLPLDISRVSWYEPLFQRRLDTFLECMSKDIMDGGWSTLFSYYTNQTAHTRWLFSFGEPVHKHSTYDFRSQLRNITLAMTQRAVVLAGTQALRRGSKNPINAVNLHEDFGVDNFRYRRLFDDYTAVLNETQRLDGFIYDEWMDDWDRGARGPFFLTAETLPDMREPCYDGGRFSHDVECSRVVGHNGHVYPEFFGLSAASSQSMKHCVHPRFSESIFGWENVWNDRIPMNCATMAPNFEWMSAAMAMLLGVLLIQVCSMCVRWGCRGGCRSCPRFRKSRDQESSRGEESTELHVGYVTIRPEDKMLCGEHQIELQSTRLRSNEEAGWWLWTHVSSQMVILEKQLQREVAATRALRGRKSEMPQTSKKSTMSNFESETSEETDDLVIATRVVHRRTMEGFASWCIYVAQSPLRSFCGKGLDTTELRAAARAVEENAERPAARLFVEALLLRTMESLGEQLLQCPERLSFLLFNIFQEAGGLEDIGPVTFSIDLDRLHDGLVQMSLHSNPYARKKMPSGKWELGLNFDDINESGIQCREVVSKTYKEPASIFVIIDFFLCYRVPIMIKLYCLAISGYIYLGSGWGDDISTKHNGTLWSPKWLRINYLQYIAMLDAAIWSFLEVLLIFYVAWQRGPSLGRHSPGIPGLKWLLEHLFNAALSMMGYLWVYSARSFLRKPWGCSHSDAGECVDPRTANLFGTLHVALTYWVCRVVVFVLMHNKQVPIFLHGTPDSKSRKAAGHGFLKNWALDARVNFAWLCMLTCCVFAEVVLLLPTMKGLDWNMTCGMDLLGDVTGLPSQRGACSESEQVWAFGCVTCVSSVLVGWWLVILGSFVDIYFVFYLASAVVGSVMGHKRHLNDLKNTSLPIDLREHQGKEAILFERAFGPGWQHIWRVMVKGLLAESLVSPKQASGLLQAAGISLDGEAPLTHRERKQKPIHLTRFPLLAAERLAFFFQSLKWVDAQGMEQATDTLTGVHFDPGSIPSLTQIIPAYNEVVIPSVEFLRAGAEQEDANNMSPDDQPGLGDMTLPPQGDGVNTNLAFMISQFPDEWVFLAKRLHTDGWTESDQSQELYQDFMKQRLSLYVLNEVRLWACLRMQSVAKTVIGALQYGKSLASLPKIKEHYAQFPDKRIAEDHVEVILAHQTYGHVEGVEANDEAVRLMLQRHADDPVYLVFDLKKGTKPELWRMVEDFLVSRVGGYTTGAFEHASVKCRWDAARNGLRVLEVLPRKFPLRLGQGEYKTQGKACNQLNGLRFASGHYVQALDCNMGTFIGEAFKVPYVLRTFLPLDKEGRSAPRCRYLGFREFIYTGREGTVGKCHAAAEWTFGTINQRFLSGMGMRMHYGHPDFLDGFWARNRGGMSKSSPVVNLSEDIFAGYNVRMREEASPHIDALEFEKGREATFNAASNFFSKISGGSISVVRSRDNHLLCERIGILHSLSFYFTSVSFYVSNLLVDLSIYLYVILFVLFNLAGMGPGELSALGSTFATEWLVSMGLVTLIPQLCEIVLEYGAMHAIRQVFGGLFAATFFFIFQNKNIASSMKEGIMTGIARYFFTGRPSANQHQTWRDIYATYWKSHYTPAFRLLVLYLVYCVLAIQNAQGRLPMVLVVISFLAWILTPILFSPFPRWSLIFQDLKEFNGFITGGAGKREAELPEVLARGKKGTVRSLYECGLSDELSVWSEHHFMMLFACIVCKFALAAFMLAIMPAGILDFLPFFLVVLSCCWVVILGYFAAGLNNVFLVLSFLIWVAAVPLAGNIIGNRFASPSMTTRAPEYLISAILFIFLLGLAKEFVLIVCRMLLSICPCLDEPRRERRLHECVRLCFVFFFTHQLQTVQAYVVLFVNALTAGALAVVDQFFCNLHTWFLLNRELARTPHGQKYMEKTATFFELDAQQLEGSDLWSSDSDSDAGSERREASGWV
mmetsp:Transcript_1645/g.4577  ORF Transcript_1645/g.4577 Transcript_1645/m.4577 type:complete len:2143 (-) Transcript_1645:437-6865(-)